MDIPFNELLRSIPTWVIVLFVFDVIMKLVAMYWAARRKQPVWYICLAIFNTLGLLPIVYLLIHRRKSRVIS
ncbi:MAG: DUF5652 family protein [Bacteroidales bacterium]|jgi:hypothetical protein|nr:DUF5652 family protein [Bacteroidales bacterium]NLM93664.1 hypothetical protein [Bacteroidales bacterium]